jgi:hypothetical protein
MFKKRGQIWIETVIYTLIAFVLIAAVLAFVKPKIDELQDKAIIEQSLSMLKDVDGTVMEIVQGGSGNKRKLEVSINKGELQIDALNNALVFEIESDYVYSEPGKEIPDGNLIIKTEELGRTNIVKATRTYEDYNLTFSGEKEIKTLPRAATPYSIFFTNKGKGADDKWMIDIELS